MDDSQLPVGALDGTRLEWSTIEAEHRGSTTRKPCDLCGHEYTGGPKHIRTHLDKSLKPRDVQVCKPRVNKVQRHNQVVAELRKRKQERDSKLAIQKKRDAARNAGAGDQAASAPSGPMDKHSKRPSEDEVTESWMRVIVKRALPLDLANDPEF